MTPTVITIVIEVGPQLKDILHGLGALIIVALLVWAFFKD